MSPSATLGNQWQISAVHLLFGHGESWTQSVMDEAAGTGLCVCVRPSSQSCVCVCVMLYSSCVSCVCGFYMRPSKTPPDRHHRTYSRSDLLICPTLTTNGPINAKDQLILDQNLLYHLSSSSIPLLLVFARSFSSFSFISACLIESPPPVWEQPGALIMWCSLPDIDLCRPPPSPSPLSTSHTPPPLSKPACGKMTKTLCRHNAIYSCSRGCLKFTSLLESLISDCVHVIIYLWLCCLAMYTYSLLAGVLVYT